MAYSFFAYLSRMKLINRWALMRNTCNENIMEHSFMVAGIAHCLAVIENKLFNGNLNVEKVLEYAIYHDMCEVLTGDLPTPVKYYNEDISNSYKAFEKVATESLADMLPQELQQQYVSVLEPDTKSREYLLMKAADKISALVKCLEEKAMNNNEFNKATKTIEDEIEKKYGDIACVKYFLDNFASAFSSSLDDLG